MTQAIGTVVIGAGAAGLAVARNLHDAGSSVVVVEARNRIGGRARTSYDFASHPVELGAEFIHGENVRTWALMERYGMHALDQVPLLTVRGYVDWQADPYTRMGYSIVPPGGAGLRDLLAEPVGNVLYLAGEATSRNRPSTRGRVARVLGALRMSRSADRGSKPLRT